ncbi:ankyrin repeat domain-containing protein [Aspergillus glaucus CBS 516.65]|uniref:Uncharacterized protein n=1 Tax=Aspergillus glaucus CBS 516.65 TaxID=1160497 RepID=A0A1L9VFY3_ASPGL|nr:hypothetical protein ASPGLDRAFT_26984 [Aspergillus glaucus CBS 516.65]OJJ82742.1 hypothetical protein ASPGLDRAFT_26984 [Aspergillus glaucus CBS 516.65]
MDNKLNAAPVCEAITPTLSRADPETVHIQPSPIKSFCSALVHIFSDKPSLTPICYILMEVASDDASSSIIFDDHGKDRSSPLHVACRAGNEQIVWILLEKGADVNALDEWRNSALQVALDSGYDNIAEMLRQNGADDGDLRDWSLI